MQGMGIGAGQAAVQWPGIGTSPNSEHDTQLTKLGDSPAQACLANFLHGHLSKVKHSPQQSIDFCTGLGDKVRVVFCRHFEVRGKWNLLKALPTSKEDCFSSNEDLSGVDAVCLF